MSPADHLKKLHSDFEENLAVEQWALQLAQDLPPLDPNNLKLWYALYSANYNRFPDNTAPTEN